MWINVLFPDNSAFSFWLRGPHNICDPLLNLLTRSSQRLLLSDLPVDSTTDCQLQLLTFECAPVLCWCHAFSGLPPVREWTWPVLARSYLTWDLSNGQPCLRPLHWSAELCSERLPTQPVLPLFPWSDMHRYLGNVMIPLSLFFANISLNKFFAHLIASWHLFLGDPKVTHHLGIY